MTALLGYFVIYGMGAGSSRGCLGSFDFPFVSFLPNGIANNVPVNALTRMVLLSVSITVDMGRSDNLAFIYSKIPDPSDLIELLTGS